MKDERASRRLVGGEAGQGEAAIRERKRLAAARLQWTVSGGRIAENGLAGPAVRAC
jgi:hypothetical protein